MATNFWCLSLESYTLKATLFRLSLGIGRIRVSLFQGVRMPESLRKLYIENRRLVSDDSWSEMLAAMSNTEQLIIHPLHKTRLNEAKFDALTESSVSSTWEMVISFPELRCSTIYCFAAHTSTPSASPYMACIYAFTTIRLLMTSSKQACVWSSVVTLNSST